MRTDSLLSTRKRNLEPTKALDEPPNITDRADKFHGYTRRYKNVRLRKKGFPTKSEAEKHLRQAMNDIDSEERGEIRVNRPPPRTPSISTAATTDHRIASVGLFLASFTGMSGTPGTTKAGVKRLKRKQVVV